MVKINGKEHDVGGIKLSDFLSSSGFDIKRIAVEKNGIIIPKKMYENTVLSDGDDVEIVSFVGGG